MELVPERKFEITHKKITAVISARIFPEDFATSGSS